LTGVQNPLSYIQLQATERIISEAQKTGQYQNLQRLITEFDQPVKATAKLQTYSSNKRVDIANILFNLEKRWLYNF